MGEFSPVFGPLYIKICSWLAIWYFKKTYGQGQRRKEIYASKSRIIKTIVAIDRLGVIDPLETHRYFSIHKRIGKGTGKDPYQWYYEKYLLYDDNTYYCIRSGRYPYQWE